MDLFQNAYFQESNNVTEKPSEWKKPRVKIMSFSYHMEHKTSIEAICTINIHTGEKAFCSHYLLKFVGGFFPDRVKKLAVYFGLYESYLHF